MKEDEPWPVAIATVTAIAAQAAAAAEPKLDPKLAVRASSEAEHGPVNGPEHAPASWPGSASQEPEHLDDKALGLLEVRHVTCIRDHDEPCSGDSLGELAPRCGAADEILLTGNDERR
jgi:hypothetical protein